MKLITIASLVVFLLCTITTNAQTRGLEIENGSARELKGVQKVFIDANANDKKTIVALIKQKLTRLTMVDTPETADVWIVFRVRTASFPANSVGAGFDSAGPTTAVDYEIMARGEVLKPVSGGHARKLVEFKDSRRFFYEADLAASFAKSFIAAYRKAN